MICLKTHNNPDLVLEKADEKIYSIILSFRVKLFLRRKPYYKFKELNLMAKNKNNQPQNKSKDSKKYRLKEQILPTPDKSADPPQPQGRNENREF